MEPGGEFHSASMGCPNCGHVNAPGSVFCQQCGTRLDVGVQSATRRCSRCQGENDPQMRFCVHCGSALEALAPAAPAGPLAPTPVAASPLGATAADAGTAPTEMVPQVASAQIQPGASAGIVQGSPAGAGQAPTPSAGSVCWRCRGVGDGGSQFCKFCGARYADAPSQSRGNDAFRATAQGPHEPQGPTAQPAPASDASRLVSIRKDGTDGQAFWLSGEQTDLGRTEGDVVLADDPYLSDRHARIRRAGREYFLRDLDSVNGVYVRLREPVQIGSGDQLLIGQQVLRFELLGEDEAPLGPARVRGVMAFGTPDVPRYARLVQYTTEGVSRDVCYLYRDETVLGRENGDLVFTDDPFLSRRHASITVERSTKRVTLQDLGSSNGTSIRLRGERILRNGDQFRVGRHLFRFDQSGAAR